MKRLKIVILFVFLGGLCALSSCTKEEVITLNPQCLEEPNAGPCLAAFQRFYFDQEEGKCKEFTWGGCNGNVPFETLEACQSCECGGE